MRRRQIYAAAKAEAKAPSEVYAEIAGALERETCPRCGREKHRGRCKK
jgi:hypothetical protein